MFKITDYSPAENLLVLNGKKANPIDMLRFTLVDLAMKGILKIHTNDVDNTKQISLNSQLTISKLKSHERIFTDIFNKDPLLKIEINTYIKACNEEVRNKAFYKFYLAKNVLKVFFKYNLVQELINDFSFSQDGKKANKELVASIIKLEAELPNLLKSQISKAIEIVRKLNGNIFLLKGIDYKLLSQIPEALWVEQKWSEKENQILNTSGPMLDVVLLFDLFHAVEDNTSDDSGCFGDGDSGDGGDGGCSGCGGCGGD